jgi:hypothetical protein
VSRLEVSARARGVDRFEAVTIAVMVASAVAFWFVH